MSDEQEKKSHDFVKATTVYQRSKTNSANHVLKTIFISFISGILGATLVLALCINVPSVRELISSGSEDTEESDSKSSDSKKTSSKTKLQQITGGVNTGVDIEEYSDTAIKVANKVLPSVVGIEVSFSVSSSYSRFSERATGTSVASGSGVIISEDGYILTNNHIVDAQSSSSYYYTVSEAKEVLVYLYEEEDPVKAEIVGTDSVTDLAILKIDKKGLTAITLGDSDKVQVGEFAMAVGNPLNFKSTVTTGIISGLNREIEDESGTMYALIQTDAAINSGNSGGALVNADGELIGINTLKIAATGVESLGFAIPINSTLDITKELIDTGKVVRPYIGISGINVTEMYSQYYNLPVGIYVEEIAKDGPAKDSDLKVGDIILEINGVKVETMSQLNKEKNKCKVGDTITLKVSREDGDKEIKIKLTEMP